MNETVLVDRLRSLTDDPVGPPDQLRHDLWSLIEPQLSVSDTRPARHLRLADAGDDGALIQLSVVRQRRPSGAVAAAIAFLAVAALGGVSLWLRGETPGPVEEDTTPPTSAVVDGTGYVPSVAVDEDGTLTLPEGLVPAAIDVADDGLVVVVADRSPRDDGAEPSEDGTVLAIDSANGRVRWQVDLDGGPSMVVAFDGAAWIAHHRAYAVTKLDLATGAILATTTIELPSQFTTEGVERSRIVTDMEMAFDSLWLSSSGSIAEIDLDSGAVVAKSELHVNPTQPDGELAMPEDIAPSDRHLWIAAGVAGAFVLDPDDHSIEVVDLHTLGHSAESLVFHNGRMFVAGNRLARNTAGSFTFSDGPYMRSEDSQATALDPANLELVGARQLPTPVLHLGVLGDQLLGFDGSGGVVRIDDESVVAGSPIHVGGLDGMQVGATGNTLWLIDRDNRALRPVTLEALMAAATSTAPGIDGPTVLWRREGIGMQHVLVDDQRLYLADRFGGSEGGTSVAAVERTTGATVWTRDDLSGVDDAAFDPPLSLRAIFGETLIMDEYDVVHAVDAATGDSQWTIRLPDGYWASGSVYTNGTLVVTASASTEGDTRPPLVYGLDPADGFQRWQTSLADGTDLQWHPPAAISGLVIVPATLSHPGSSTGNMVHAVDAATGQIVWAVDLGGTQGFHSDPVLTDESRVLVRGPEGTVALDVDSGRQLWQVNGAWPLVMTPDGDALASTRTNGNEGILRVDPASGSATVFVEQGALEESPAGAAIHDGTAIMSTISGLVAFDLGDGSELWSWISPAFLVDRAAVTSGFAAVPTADQATIGLSLP